MLKHIKHLSRRGWEVTILNPREPNRSWPDRSLEGDVPNEAELYYVPHSQTFWGRLRSYFHKLRELRSYRDWDWLVTTSPADTNQYLGGLFSRGLGLRWHCDLRDPPNLTGYRRIKAWCIRRAELVTICDHRPMRMPDLFQSHDNVHWIPNGFDPDDSKSSPCSRTSNDPCRFVYTGTMHRPVHEPLVLLRAFGRLHRQGRIDEGNARLLLMGRIMGEGLRTEVHRLLDNYDLTSIVTLEGFSPHQTAMEALRWADVGIVN